MRNRWYPIQVTQKECVDAVAECAAFHRKTGRIIKLITAQDILEGDHVQKM